MGASIRVAVVGSPNTGKTTLINAISGSRLEVGNWPGVTVEKKYAKMSLNGVELELVDLPGVYSLYPYSVEEKIAVDFLIDEKPDLVLFVADATNLEKSLYLLIQVLEIGLPTIVALNIFDEAKKLGYEIDIRGLEETLGVKIIPTVAIKGIGIREILEFIKAYSQDPSVIKVKKVKYKGETGNFIEEVSKKLVEKYPNIREKYDPYWISIRILEEDENILSKIDLDEEFLNYLEDIKTKIKKIFNDDAYMVINRARLGIVNGIYKEYVKKKKLGNLEFTEKLDKIILNRYLGLPAFLFIIWVIFKITFDFTAPLCDWLDGFISDFAAKWVIFVLSGLGLPEGIINLIKEGVFAGVGGVLSFIPLVAVVMFLITFLEGSGLMARIAVIVDRIMHLFGLHGKSFIPLIIGFGCNVPSVFATRVLETERERKITALLIPCMSCSARLPVYMLLIGAIFPDSSGTILFLIYALGVVVAFVVGLILNRFVYKGSSPELILELPAYRMPTLSYLTIFTWEKLKHFVKKAGTFILISSIIIWLLSNIPYGAKKEDTVLGTISRAILPVFKPIGIEDWRKTAAIVTGVAAKEIVISTMSILYGAEEENKGGNEVMDYRTFIDDLKRQVLGFVDALDRAVINLFSVTPKKFEAEEAGGTLKDKIRENFNRENALSFMVFVLLYWPCSALMATYLSEFGVGFLLRVIIIYSLVPWVASFIVYNIARVL